jgi:NADH:ubiquinone oxidoreductase subunit F (NADH-binding)
VGAKGVLRVVSDGLDDTTRTPTVTQAVTRFLFVESCNQCSACKAELRIASSAMDELIVAREARADLFERVVLGAKQAPQGNRCYLPVEAYFVVSSRVKPSSSPTGPTSG